MRLAGANTALLDMQDIFYRTNVCLEHTQLLLLPIMESVYNGRAFSVFPCQCTRPMYKPGSKSMKIWELNKYRSVVYFHRNVKLYDGVTRNAGALLSAHVAQFRYILTIPLSSTSSIGSFLVKKLFFLY